MENIRIPQICQLRVHIKGKYNHTYIQYICACADFYRLITH